MYKHKNESEDSSWNDNTTQWYCQAYPPSNNNGYNQGSEAVYVLTSTS